MSLWEHGKPENVAAREAALYEEIRKERERIDKTYKRGLIVIWGCGAVGFGLFGLFIHGFGGSF